MLILGTGWRLRVIRICQTSPSTRLFFTRPLSGHLSRYSTSTILGLDKLTDAVTRISNVVTRKREVLLLRNFSLAVLKTIVLPETTSALLFGVEVSNDRLVNADDNNLLDKNLSGHLRVYTVGEIVSEAGVGKILISTTLLRRHAPFRRKRWVRSSAPMPWSLAISRTHKRSIVGRRKYCGASGPQKLRLRRCLPCHSWWNTRNLYG